MGTPCIRIATLVAARTNCSRPSRRFMQSSFEATQFWSQSRLLTVCFKCCALPLPLASWNHLRPKSNSNIHRQPFCRVQRLWKSQHDSYSTRSNVAVDATQHAVSKDRIVFDMLFKSAEPRESDPQSVKNPEISSAGWRPKIRHNSIQLVRKLPQSSSKCSASG